MPRSPRRAESTEVLNQRDGGRIRLRRACFFLEVASMKLEHVALDVSDPDKFIDWWCHNLGFRRSKPGSAFILDDSGVMGLEIYRTGETPQAPEYAKMNSMTLHIAFVSDDVKRDCDRLVEAGATLEQLSLENPAFHMAILRDPWGVPIQLCKRANSIFFE